MKTYIVSIEEDNSPRLNKLFSQPFFKDGQTKFCKVGIKGGNLSAKQYFELGVKGRSKPLSPSMVGCTLSHLEALKAFLATDDEYALVIEDDAIFPNDLTIEKLSTALSSLKLPRNTLFSIGGIRMKECQKVRGDILDQEFLSQKILKVSPDFYQRICYAVAYIVDREIAQTLINYHRPVRAADDWRYLTDFNETASILMTAIVDHPIIAAGEQNSQLSSIEQERVESSDVPMSRFGTPLRYNIAKFLYKKYPK
ncbi:MULTISPECIES: glycosyltransferase family 25 protein [unclassified Acinetobacter]|uniref:glycosyltransferase family 25 protein n=1 Tax=unclassified Acinetobacter TaxID=196816 RepID=UPI0012066E13|nr:MULTISPECIES: glycosyltransferase family 25 protein [unclassified Acinetobacter]RZJ22316.1 MAG: glycosyltransferase family 25 protein [Acinetobacter sp.]